MYSSICSRHYYNSDSLLLAECDELLLTKMSSFGRIAANALKDSPFRNAAMVLGGTKISSAQSLLPNLCKTVKSSYPCAGVFSPLVCGSNVGCQQVEMAN